MIVLFSWNERFYCFAAYGKVFIVFKNRRNGLSVVNLFGGRYMGRMCGGRVPKDPVAIQHSQVLA